MGILRMKIQKLHKKILRLIRSRHMNHIRVRIKKLLNHRRVIISSETEEEEK